MAVANQLRTRPAFKTALLWFVFITRKLPGFEVNETTVKRAVAATVRQQKPDFTYLYGEYMKNNPMAGINRPGGSLGRSQCCNVALRPVGRRNHHRQCGQTLAGSLYERNGWLDMGRKRPIPHESWMGVAGYFYYFGHYYGAISMEQLPLAERERIKD